MSLLSKLLYLRVKVEYSPTKLKSLGINPDIPFLYVLSSESTISRSILWEEINRGNLPKPFKLDSEFGLKKSILASEKTVGFWNQKLDFKDFETQLEDLIVQIRNDQNKQLQLIPISVFLGRAPDKDHGFFKVIFSEKWGITGRFRKFFSVLVHGKHTLVRLSQPILVNKDLDTQDDPVRMTHKLSRVLRLHNNRVKTSVVGRDLSHRRTIAKNIIKRPIVQQEIRNYAERRKLAPEIAEKEAEKIIREIAADYSYSAIKFMSGIFRWFWTKVYDGVKLNFFDELRNLATEKEIIYTPCHRSHIDYLILSYSLYERGIVPPHIAAGINLNLPVVGRILRGSGAFFLRRSFNSALYSTIFSEYLSSLIAHGVSIEYFIEGTRSRTGRLLHPKAGMLAMTVRSYLNERSKPLVFVPSSLNYEKLMEGASYKNELGGKGKKKESIGGLFKTWKLLKEDYGRLTVNFSEHIELDRLLDKHQPNWREIKLGVKEKPQWFKDVVSEAGNEILTNINKASHVNPINLLAVTLLSTPNRAASEKNLRAQIELYRKIILNLPYSERTTVTELTVDEIIAKGVNLGFIQRVEHPLGDVVQVKDEMGVLMTYYRNNVLHLFAASSFIAMFFVNDLKQPRREILRLMAIVYPFIKNELFLKWTREEFVEYGRKTLKLLKDLDLLVSVGRNLERHKGGSLQAAQLRVLANALMQTYERFFIVIALLKKRGSGTLTSGELESLCQQVASQLSLLYEFNSPDFFDKNLFKQFISVLKEEQIIKTDPAGKIIHSDNLEPMYLGAKNILSRRIRHSILYLL
ncbi:glycerol-3-phosphate 1-O-acyltransferase PlsB [Marinicella sp. S1101]|uniref:glycerol-3-phosphate 1-O-acyltransferase PlsB n=1 Tax=Marinicella marina TaxID=2996016 RepID=UPI002260A312|nr:glycerol-3-phosphate 1-O-acyltransferase PlsB [Marinicella marina]MCX7553367.1 glycerol-3-phosphate 1-O-acyltransferase PlsB [Marinicella marina]MDJ1139099.1 glycerol-3-phosphate 1-O-acyltransferase PlsB [Marinicella marina]